MNSNWIRAAGTTYRALLCFVPCARYVKMVATNGAIFSAVLFHFISALSLAGAGWAGTPDFANVTVDAAAVGAQIQTDVFGANMSVGFDTTNPPG
jgi:hypothetical protein